MSAHKIAHFANKYTGNSIALYGSGQLTMEGQYLANLFMKGVLGSNTIEANARMSMTSAVTGYFATLGSDTPPFAKPEVEEIEQSEESTDNLVLPKVCPPLAIASVNTNECLPYNGPECGACKGSCPIPDTLLWNNEKPSINPETCIGCSQCRDACITNPKVMNITTL